jgi:SAM-dependent methyltransferase
MRMAGAFQESALLFAASDVGVFAKLAELGEAHAAALAGALCLDTQAARMLLDGCAAVGLLQKTGDRYRNAPDAQAFLVPGAPGDLSGVIRYNRDVMSAWSRLAQFAREGGPVESPALHLGADPARTRTFVLAMHERALGIGRAVAGQVRVEGCRRLLDVGGGPGTYSCLLAQRNPELRCTVMDLPPVAAIAEELIAAQGLAGRVTLRPGSYRTDPFGGPYDAVIFFGVLHQEAPESIARLLRKAFDALEPGGVVYVLDLMTDLTRTQPAFSALFAINMALTTEHGWVFSDEELRVWMAAAGFSGFEVRPAPPPMPHWLACARKPRGESRWTGPSTS